MKLYHFVRTILSNTILFLYHFVHTTLCTILSATILSGHYLVYSNMNIVKRFSLHGISEGISFIHLFMLFL